MVASNEIVIMGMIEPTHESNIFGWVNIQPVLHMVKKRINMNLIIFLGPERMYV